MLILSRKKNESIIINDDIKIVVIGVSHGRVRLGIAAPKDVSINREEVCEAINGKKDESAKPA